MFKTTNLIGLLGTLLVLSGCAPAAYVVGTSNTPINYTYTQGYNPPQAAYPDVPTDANTLIDSTAVIQQERAINSRNNQIAEEQQHEMAVQQEKIQQELNEMHYQP